MLGENSRQQNTEAPNTGTVGTRSTKQRGHPKPLPTPADRVRHGPRRRRNCTKQPRRPTARSRTAVLNPAPQATQEPARVLRRRKSSTATTTTPEVPGENHADNGKVPRWRRSVEGGRRVRAPTGHRPTTRPTQDPPKQPTGQGEGPETRKAKRQVPDPGHQVPKTQGSLRGLAARPEHRSPGTHDRRTA